MKYFLISGDKLSKIIFLFFIFVIFIFIYEKINYENKKSNCLNSFSEEVISNCQYILKPQDNLNLLENKLAKMDSNIIRQSYIISVESFGNENLTEKRLRVLEECFAKNGCINTYIAAFDNSSYGFSRDWKKVDNAYKKNYPYIIHKV